MDSVTLYTVRLIGAAKPLQAFLYRHIGEHSKADAEANARSVFGVKRLKLTKCRKGTKTDGKVIYGHVPIKEAAAAVLSNKNHA